MKTWKLTVIWGKVKRIKFYLTEEEALNAANSTRLYAASCGLKVETKIRETITKKGP